MSAYLALASFISFWSIVSFYVTASRLRFLGGAQEIDVHIFLKTIKFACFSTSQLRLGKPNQDWLQNGPIHSRAEMSLGRLEFGSLPLAESNDGDERNILSATRIDLFTLGK